MKRILLLSVAITIALTSCIHAPDEPTDLIKKSMQEKMNLVQVVHCDPKTTDVFGDSVQVGKYYVYTNHYELVPVAYVGTLSPGRSTIQEYLDAKKSAGNLHSDTTTVIQVHFRPQITLRIYDLKGVDVSEISLR